jgi:DNA-binding MarR family transcriptional regulator
MNDNYSLDTEKALVEIMRTSNLLEQPFNNVFRKFGLTQTQYNILRILRGSLPEFLTAGALKQKMVNPTSDSTRLTDRLVLKKLVERKINPNSRREMYIKITEKGLNLLNEINPDLQELIGFYSKNLVIETNNLIEQLVKIQETTLLYNQDAT